MYRLWEAAKRRQPAFCRLFAVFACLCLLPCGCSAYGQQVEAPARDGLDLHDALVLALDRNAEIRQGRSSVDVAKSRVARATGIFDSRYVFSGTGLHSYHPLTDYEHNLAVAAGVDTYQQSLTYNQLRAAGTKLLRDGVELRSTLSVDRADDNLENIGGVNRTTFDAGLTVPLLAGRGRRATEFRLRQSERALEGSVQEWNASIAGVLERTGLHFLQLAAAQARLAVAGRAVETARQFEGSVDALIREDKLPAVETHRAHVATTQRRMQLVLERARILEAQRQLAVDLGVDSLEMLRLKARAEEFAADFVPAEASADEVAVRSQVELALRLRSEMGGAEARTGVAALRQDEAAEAVRRRLDLQISSGYAGLSLGETGKDYGRSMGNRIGGANVQASLTYTFDPSRTAAKADLAEAAAEVSRSSQAERSLRQRIGAEVVASVEGVRLQRDALVEAGTLLAERSSLAEAQQRRLQAGAGPLSDALTAQSDLLDAELAMVDARQHYAEAVLTERYSAGAMLGTDATHPQVQRSEFYTVDQAPGVQP